MEKLYITQIENRQNWGMDLEIPWFFPYHASTVAGMVLYSSCALPSLRCSWINRRELPGVFVIA